MKKINNYTFIDLFGGCGGLSLGLEQAGFKCILFNEINESARTTFNNNYTNKKEKPVIIPDVNDLNTKSLSYLKNDWTKKGISDIDLVVGGPPCWGFSRIGYKRTFDGNKKDIKTNYLFNKMVEVISIVRPRMFLFENVKGLISSRWEKDSKKGEIWDEVKKKFKYLESYHIEFDIIEAYKYGVPQNRPRVFLVGYRESKNNVWRPKLNAPCGGLLPTFDDTPIPSVEDFIGDLIDESYKDKSITESYPTNPLNKIQRELRKNGKSIFNKGDPLFNHEYSRHSDPVINKFRYMINNKGRIHHAHKTKKFRQKVLPRNWSNGKPDFTITSLPDDYVHYEQPRSLTVREMARLQTFPDHYIFYGPRTTGGRRRAGEPSDNFENREIPQYTQIGNAVPVIIAKKFGKHFKKIFNKGE